MYVTKDAAHMVVPWHATLSGLIPHARELNYNGERLLVIPNNRDEAKLARNLGIQVPAPILTRYDWAGTKPWDIQRTTAALLTESPRFFLLSTMGTGKTRSVLFAADYMMRYTGARKLLISAPLSTLTPVWETEMFNVLPRRKVVVLYGSKAKRLQLLSQEADVYIINHHGTELLLPELLARNFDMVVIDELAIMRNRSTGLWKAHNSLVNATSTRYAWGLTGAPTPKAPTDAWAQIKMFTPTRVSRTMTMFQDQTMQRVSQFKLVPRHNANDIVFAAMQPSVRYTLDDVMELPPTMFVDREVKLNPDAEAAYRLLYKKMRMLTNNGESITAVNEGVLQGKLLQVACGFIYTDTQRVYELDSTSRLEALDGLVDETDRKVLVFVPFIHALQGITKHLAKRHNVTTVYGATPRNARDRIFKNFQDKSHPLRIIVAHPQTMAHGLTLTEANLIAWYGPTQSLEIYDQANARIVRPGQTSKTIIAHLYATAVERAVYARLKSRARMQGLLLDMFQQQELEF